MYRWRDVFVVASLAGLTAACGTTDGTDDDDSTPTGFPIGPQVDADGEVSSTPYGPENSWYHASESEVPSGLEGTGRGAGDIAYNLNLSDQFGDDVELYQFYGNVVVLDLYAEW